MFNHEELIVYNRGEFLHFKDAHLSIANTGFLYGLGVFSGIRAHFNETQNKLFVFRPQAHFERLRFGCKVFGFKNFLNSMSYENFTSMLSGLITKNNIREDVYIRVSAYSDENRITPKFVYKDSLSAFLYPLGDYVPSSGMRCMVSSWTRVEDNALPARLKSHGSYVNTAFAKSEALGNGYDEALFLNSRGFVVEGSAENLFIVSDGMLITPPKSDNILEGITRDTVLQFAKDEGIPFSERSIARSELYRADEVFLTGTGAKVSPVTEIDKYPVGDGKVGPISSRLQKLYQSVVRGEVKKYANWLHEV